VVGPGKARSGKNENRYEADDDQIPHRPIPPFSSTGF
jgi:hypothetical protein